jgi:hypothetical protein
MARLISLRAPESLRVDRKSQKELDAYVAEHAGRYLAQMPKDIRPAGISGVTLESLVKGTASDPGVWAQWTRACCDRRNEIDDFVDPLRGDLEIAAAQLRPQVAEHIEALHVTQTLANPKMHGQ